MKTRKHNTSVPSSELESIIFLSICLPCFKDGEDGKTPIRYSVALRCGVVMRWCGRKGLGVGTDLACGCGFEGYTTYCWVRKSVRGAKRERERERERFMWVVGRWCVYR